MASRKKPEGEVVPGKEESLPGLPGPSEQLPSQPGDTFLDPVATAPSEAAETTEVISVGPGETATSVASSSDDSPLFGVTLDEDSALAETIRGRIDAMPPEEKARLEETREQLLASFSKQTTANLTPPPADELQDHGAGGDGPAATTLVHDGLTGRKTSPEDNLMAKAPSFEPTNETQSPELLLFRVHPLGKLKRDGVTYAPGALIELTADEAKAIAQYVEPLPEDLESKPED